jgi:hypothetical protein
MEKAKYALVALLQEAAEKPYFRYFSSILLSSYAKGVTGPLDVR